MSATVKAHGLDGGLVTPDWAPLTLTELGPVLGQFPALGAPVGILFASPRPFSAAALVATTNGRVFVKRHHHAVRDREGLLEEHRFLAHLFDAGAPVPRVLISESGETVMEADDWTYEVHEPARGLDLYGDAISWTPFRAKGHARAAGQALGRLHRLAEGFAAPRRKAQPLVASFIIFAASDPTTAMERYLAARPALAEHVRVRDCAAHALDLVAPFHAELRPFLPALEPLWTHNDLHASNLFFSNGGDDSRATAIIDFGLADRTNAVHDLAHTMERNIVEWLTLVENPSRPEAVAVHFDHLQALLEGYESVRPLGDEEAAALAPMTALCHAEFALSEADYFLGVLHSDASAAMAYDGWLMGHARWFLGPGRRLLDALRAWAESRVRTAR